MYSYISFILSVDTLVISSCYLSLINNAMINMVVNINYELKNFFKCFCFISPILTSA